MRRDELDHIEGLELVRRRSTELLDEGRPAVFSVPGTTKGAKIAAAIASAATEAGEASSPPHRRRSHEGDGDSGGEKAAVNPDSSMSPRARPIARSHRPFAAPPQLDERRVAEGPEHDERPRREVAKRPPAITNGITIHMRTARDAVSAERRRRHAMTATSAGGAPTERRGSADAGAPIGPKKASRLYHERDHWRMVEVAEGERTRPDGLAGFVEGEFEAFCGDSLHGQKRKGSPAEMFTRTVKEGCAGTLAEAAPSATDRYVPPLVALSLLSIARPSHGARAGSRSQAEAGNLRSDMLIHTKVWRRSHTLRRSGGV